MQIPRLYNVYKAQGLLDSFEQMIENIFLPLFEVTADPTSHPQLHIFLQQVRTKAPVLTCALLTQSCGRPLAWRHGPPCTVSPRPVQAPCS